MGVSDEARAHMPAATRGARSAASKWKRLPGPRVPRAWCRAMMRDALSRFGRRAFIASCNSGCRGASARRVMTALPHARGEIIFYRDRQNVHRLFPGPRAPGPPGHSPPRSSTARAPWYLGPRFPVPFQRVPAGAEEQRHHRVDADSRPDQDWAPPSEVRGTHECDFWIE